MREDQCSSKALASIIHQTAQSAIPRFVATSSEVNTIGSEQIQRLAADRLLTIHEFCKRYKRSRSRAYQLIQSGEILAVKEGRSTLIPVDAAEAWVRQL